MLPQQIDGFIFANEAVSFASFSIPCYFACALNFKGEISLLLEYDFFSILYLDYNYVFSFLDIHLVGALFDLHESFQKRAPE